MKQPIHGRHADQESNHKIVGEFPIYLDGRYHGMITAQETYAGMRWAHSLQSHGTLLFETSAEAAVDFEETKLRLPAAVHHTIFGA